MKYFRTTGAVHTYASTIPQITRLFWLGIYLYFFPPITCCFFAFCVLTFVSNSHMYKLNKEWTVYNVLYPINFDWFSWGWSKKIHHGRLKKLRFSTPPILKFFFEFFGLYNKLMLNLHGCQAVQSKDNLLLKMNF